MRLFKRLSATVATVALAGTLVAGLAASPAGAVTNGNGVINGYGSGIAFQVGCSGSYFNMDEMSVLGANTTASAFRITFYSWAQRRWSAPSAWAYPQNYIGGRAYQYTNGWNLAQWNIPAMGTGAYSVWVDYAFRDRYNVWHYEGVLLNSITSTYAGATSGVNSQYCYSQQGGW